MKALILDGSKESDDAIRIIRKTIENELKNIDCVVDSLTLRDINIAPCRGHLSCWFKTPGICIIDDTARDVARMIIQSNVLIFLTPITFGGYSPELKKVLDRLIPIMLPYFIENVKGDVHHAPRYTEYPNLVVIGTLPCHDDESEQIFKNLVTRNAINLFNPNHTGEIILNSEKENSVREKIKNLKCYWQKMIR
jgi:multimeric flavodoxin WrbA